MHKKALQTDKDTNQVYVYTLTLAGHACRSKIGTRH